MLNTFVKTYGDRRYRFPVMLNHAGVVLAFAMDELRRIHYTVLDLAHAATPMDVDAWLANPAPLPFPNELVPVGFAATDPTALPQVKLGTTSPVAPGIALSVDDIDPFLSSTARLTAAVAFQVVSDGRFVYVFRQSITDPAPDVLLAAQQELADPAASAAQSVASAEIAADHANIVYATQATGQPVTGPQGRPVPLVDGRLLVDRFLLVGTQLQPKLEVRYQRSRNKNRPASRTDGLGAKDLDGRPFIEPTQELRFLPPPDGGRFCALLAPTSVADAYRWQIFTAEQGGGALWSYSIEQSADGLFDTAGSQAWSCSDHPDLFAMAPGSCPRPSLTDPTLVCGKSLVPAVEQSGAAGSALSFTAANSVVTLSGVPALGSTFTLEAWVRVPSNAPGEQVLIGGGGDDSHSAPTVRVLDGTRLRIGFGDGTALQSATTDPVLTSDRWQHVSASLSDTLLTVCVNGVPVATSGALAGHAPVGTAVSQLGATSGGFAGQLDEVRLWGRARTVEEVRADLHLRLSGLEEGLLSYWRLDEGKGTTIWDQAGAASGVIASAAWVTSDAPVGQSRGVGRTALRVAGRAPSGGMSALLYYLQEYAPSGYSIDTPKPQKGAARAMLAAVTSPPDAPPGPGQVTVLDFAIGQDGRLADLPTEVALSPHLVAASGASGSTNALLDRLAADQATIANLEADIATTTQVVAELTNGIAAAIAAQHGQPVTQLPTGAAQDLQLACVQSANIFQVIYDLTRSQLTSPALVTAQAALQPLLVQLSNGIAQHTAQLNTETITLGGLQQQLASVKGDVASLRQQVNGDVPQPMPLLHIDGDGSTVVGAVLDFAVTADSPVLFDSALGRLGLYFCGDRNQLSVAYYDTFTGHAQYTLPAGAAGALTVLPRTTEGEFDTLTITTAPSTDSDSCTLTISLDGGGSPNTETWNGLPRDPHLLSAIVNGQPPAPVPVGSAAAAAGNVDHLTIAAGITAPLGAGALLSVGGTVVRVSEAAVRGARTIAIQPIDLAVAGGAVLTVVSYDYDRRASTTLPGATLANGSRLVILDARGAAGAVADATATLVTSSPSARWFGAPPGTALEFDGDTTVAGVLGTTALTLDGAHDSVSLGNPETLDITGTVTLEAWIRATATGGIRDIVSRGYATNPNGEVALRINSGAYQVGSWDGTDHFITAPIPAGDLGKWVHLSGTYDGTGWLLYRNGVLLAQQAATIGAVPVSAGWAVGSSAGGDRLFAGDIDEVRIWRRPRTALEIADAANRRLDGSEAGLAGYWYFAEGAFRDQTATRSDGTLRGAPQASASPPVLTAGADFDVLGDVTVEAWVNPGSAPGVARIVQHRSASSNYLLGLRPVLTALTFDGLTQYATIANSASLNIQGVITLEAWIYPTDTGGLRYIVAHGLQPTPQREVALRINNGSYQFGCYDGADHYAVAAIPQVDLGRWVHLAGVYDATSWLLYRDGVLMATRQDPTGATSVNASWAIGASADGQRFFAGRIGEVRLWNVARTADQVAAVTRRWLAGTEPGLVACWRYDGARLVDVTPAQRTITPLHSPAPTAGPVPAYHAVAGTGVHYVETTSAFVGGAWTHLAVAFMQDYAVHLSGSGDYLDAGAKMALDVSGDLTVEVAVCLDDLSAPQGLLTRGILADGGGQRVPYALCVQTDGSVVLCFEDSDGTVQPFASNPGAVTTGTLHRIAVTRKRNVRVDTSGPTAVVDKWDEIDFTVDHTAQGSHIYTGKDAGSSDEALLFGRAHATDGTEFSLRGTLTEVRVWSKARDAAGLGDPINGSEVGLVSWWRFDEGTANVAEDAKGGSPARLRGGASWIKTPDPTGSMLNLYRDGVVVATALVSPSSYASSADGFAIGGDGTVSGKDLLRGQLEELRIWRVTRTSEQIQDNLFRRLSGERQDLVAYYTFDAEPGARLSDQGMRGNDLSVISGSYPLSTAPVGDDAPQVRNAVAGVATDYTSTIAAAPGVAEYADLQRAADGSTAGIFKRCYATVATSGEWQLITGFKVGDLAVEWVGQAQFDPQLIGYIEGAPPVPSENLTVNSDGYQGASSITITEATSTTYTYASSRNAGIDASLEVHATLGDKSMTFAGASLMEIEAPLGIGIGESEILLEEVLETDASVGTSLSVETSLSWTASSEGGSGSTLTHVSGLDLNGRQESPDHVAHPAIGPRWLPDNIGLALVQSQTADIFAMRLIHTGALVAYQMRANPDIPKDWNIITFPLDPRYVKQGTLDGKVGLEPDSDYPGALAYSSDSSYFKPVEAYQLKEQIARQEQELATLFAQYDAGPGGLTAMTGSAIPRPTKRNLVSTYVWTADGGTFAETNDAMDSLTETTGGSFSFSTMLGANVTADIMFATVALTLDVTAQIGAHLELEVSKTKDSQNSFGLDVIAGPERNIFVADPAGHLMAQPGKVDAYRFMTFYLAPNADFHDVFFNQVLDPIWLATSDTPAAAALRGARQAAKRPACWRVLHRVTFVSRVLAPVSASPDPFTQALRSLDIASNYELVKSLEPYVVGRTGSSGDFVAAVKQAVAARLPDLLPHVDDVVSFLLLYYGIGNATR